MNRCYRLVWNRARRLFVVASEISRGRGKAGRSAPQTRRLAWVAALPLSLSPLLALALAPASVSVHVAQLAPAVLMQASSSVRPVVVATASPSGGQVTAGSGAINQNGLTTTINQHSQNLSLSWQSFNIGADSTVNFLQPNAQSIAVNRIADSNGSVILGHLNANGQVFLINPNGVLFGQGAQVNVGGLVASTLNVGDNELGSGTLHFSGNSSGSVINRGTLNAANGYIALLGPAVSNQGTLSANGGTVALAGGNVVTLSFDNKRLVSLQVDKSTLNALADNQQLIVANGGQVLMSAGARDSLLASVVNNTGTIQAQTVENRAGKIVLLGGMAAGTAHVGGTLDASAPGRGNGGFIETSAAKVNVSDEASITTAADRGSMGTWLIDPTDFTVAASGGDITGSTLGNNLASSNVTIESSQGSAGVSGNINVNDQVNWGANTTLTLNAQNDINLNAGLTATGSAGKLALEYGQGAVVGGNSSDYHVNAAINLAAGNNFSTKQGSDGSAIQYTVITTLGSAGSITGSDLQGIAGNVGGHYALGANIDANATAGWNGGAGFDPLGGNSGGKSLFTGNFDGLGHTITGLTVNRPDTENVGLFGVTYNSTIRNIGMTDVSVLGSSSVGGLIGYSNLSKVSHVYATGDVESVGYAFTGGLIGFNYSAVISDAYASATVTGMSATSDAVGGLVGRNSGGVITRAYATGAVSGASLVGGLVGNNLSGSTISDSYAIGAVSSANGAGIGGLVGDNSGLIIRAYAVGAVNGYGLVGGLVGGNSAGGSIDQVYATGAVNGGVLVGGLVGSNASGGTINQAYATGAINGGSAGGLVGVNRGAISQAYATGNVLGQGGGIGGLVGENYGSIDQSYATGSMQGAGSGSGVTGDVIGPFGGLVGNSYNGSSATASYWNTQTSGQSKSAGGTGLTTAQMMNPASFSGWDIATTGGSSSVWRSYQGHSAPLLRAFMTDLAVTAKDVSVAYNGTAFAGSSDYLFGALMPSFWNPSPTVDRSLLHGNAVTAGPAVNAGNYALTGDLYSSQRGYDVNFTAGTLTISPAALTVTTDNVSKTYDGTTTALGNVTLTSGTLFGTDTLSGGSFQFDNKNAGTGKAVMVSGVTVNDGRSGGNYAVIYVDNTSSTITPADLTVTTVDVSKTYDGTTSASGSLALTSGVLFGGDSLSGGSFAFDDKNAGSGKKVHVSGATVSDGNGGGNYAVRYADNVTSTILAKAIASVSGISAANKIYDGTVAATVDGSSASFNGIIVGDDLTVGSADGHFSDKNAAQGKTVTVDGITLGGVDAGNYTLADARATTTANISQLGITVEATGGNKVYDGTTADAIALASAGVIAGDAINFAGSGTFADKNVGSAKTVTVNGIAASGADAGNYSFNTTAATTADITARGVTINATGTDRVYDGTTADVVALTSAGVLAGDTVQLTGSGSFADKNVGKAKTVAIDVAASGADAGNYSFNVVPGTTADISALGITVGATGGSKIYDGTAFGSVTLAGSGVLAGDAVTFTGDGIFADKNVGTGKTVTVSDITATGADAGNYSYNTTANTTADVTQLGITVGATGSDKVYDGTTADAIALASAGVIAGDAINFAGSGTFADKNVGTAKIVTVDGIAASGVDAGNYSFNTTAATTADITARDVTINATGTDRVYDGTAADVVALTSTGLLSGDVVQLAGTGSFADKNVGSAKAVTVDVAATGVDAGNYSFNVAPDTTADISALGITVGATGGSKVYDGTAFGSVTLAGSGVLAGDVVTFTGNGIFADKNVGTAKAVTVSDIAATGADAGNYSYNSTANTTADVTQRGITVEVTGSNKVYDGTTADAITLAGAGVIAGDAINFAGSGSFADKNVGAAKTVTVNGIAASGVDAGNYSFNTTAATTADITARDVTINATGTDRVYDGTTADVVALTNTGVVAGDLVQLTGTGSFADKNVGSAKVVTIDVAASGADAGNYRYNVTPGTTADVTALGITVNATGSNKVYDGTTAGNVTLGSTGVLVGDVVGFSGTGSFNDKNVGDSKAVAVSGIAASGTDAGNYSYNTAAKTTANITPATLTYRAAPVFVVIGQPPGALGGAVAGLVGGDTLAEDTGGTLAWNTLASADSPVGPYAIDGSGLTALNYVFKQAATNATALRVIYANAPLAVTSTIARLQQQDEIVRKGVLASPDVRIVDGGVRLP